MALPTDNDQQSRINKGYEDGFNNHKSAYTGANLGEQESYTAPSSDNSLQESEEQPWVNNTSKQTETKEDIEKNGKIKGWAKKGSAGVAVGGGIIGIIFTMIITPAMGITHMKEIFQKDLDDQVAARQIRSDHVIGGKLKEHSSGLCSNLLSIRCRFSTMSNKEVERFKKAGFTINESSDSLLGRKRIISMTAPNGAIIKNPKDLREAAIKSGEVRSALRKAYNPMFMGLSDKVAAAVFSKNKTNKQKKITGSTDEERKQSLEKVTSGDKAGSATGTMKDKDGTYVLDDEGNKVYEGSKGYDEALQKSQSQAGERISGKASVGGKAMTGLLRTGLTGLSVIGVADTACTVYATSNAVGAAAKVIRSQQLIQFAMVVLTTADSIKAGDATPEEVSFVGNMLTQTDTRKKIINETSELTGVNGSTLNGAEVDNPFYKKSAFDSPGYKTAAYNDAPTLTSRSQQYMIGGGLTGTLANVNTWVNNHLPGDRKAKRDTCKMVQNPFVRGAGFVAGIFAAVGSFGIWTAVGIGGSLAFGFAMPFLEAALADMIAGKVISPDITGVEAGDAAFAGTGALLGQMAQHRGMQPLDKEGLKSYVAVTDEVNSDIAAAEAYDARNTPFDAYNQYSFLGSLVNTLYPSLVKFDSNAPTAIASIGSIISTGFSSLTKPISANKKFNDERFSKCTDEGYRELGIDADIFCNVRYGLTNQELSLDTNLVADFMVNQGYVSEEGEPKKEYKDFMEYCAKREDGWGEVSSEGGGDNESGRNCIDRLTSWADIKYFRVYTMDSQILDSMEEE